QQSTAPNSDCGGGSSMNGLSDSPVCTPTGVSAFPCTEPYRTGTVAGTTVQTIAGLPGRSGSSWNNCAMLLPISDGCDSGTLSCDVLTYARFLIMDGTLPVNGAYSPKAGCNSNCHIGQLLPVGMIPSIKAGAGVFDPQTGTGLFTVELSCDPVGGACNL